MDSLKMLNELAHRGMSVLDVPADGAQSANMEEIFAYANFQKVTDLRDERMHVMLNRLSSASLALALDEFFEKLDNVREMARCARLELSEASAVLYRRTRAQESALTRMNDEVDRADFISGTGFDARCTPPSAVRAIDAAIVARARWEESLTAYTKALSASACAEESLANLERLAALIRVAHEGSTEL